MLFFTLYFRAISKYKLPWEGGGGGGYLKGRFNAGFFALQVLGLIFGGAYFWKFMVCWSLFYSFASVFL